MRSFWQRFKGGFADNGVCRVSSGQSLNLNELLWPL